MAARIAAEQEEERGGRTPAGSGRPAAPASTNDPNLVAKLSSEGWLEHRKSGKG